MKTNIKICNLRINHFATIESQEIHFTEGFNAIVGETGSGKSLILNAFNILLGNKADKKFIRKGCDFYTVEGTFQSKDPTVKKFFEEQNIFIESEFTIKRVVNREGSSKSFINLQSIPVSLIRSFALEFFDIIGQHENQKLLQSDYQLRLLDSYAGNAETLEKYRKPFQEFTENKKQLIALKEKFELAERQIDYLEFQIEQLESLSPTTEEEQKLIQEKESIQSIVDNNQGIQKALQIVSEDNQGNLIQFAKNIESILSVTNLPGSLKEKVEGIIDLSSEISFELSRLLTDEDSEGRLGEIIDRLDAYQKLKRKFKTDTQGLQETLEGFQKQRDEFLSIESEIEKTQAQIANLKNKLWTLSRLLHDTRRNLAVDLTQELQKIFKKINLSECEIKFDFDEVEDFKPTGRTLLTTLIQTNPGEDFQPISKIASGGELSRILLAFRTCCADPESISIFLFDEVDAGIGGKTAKMIGSLIKEISENTQVIAITHLPQIAAFANNLIHVYKDTKSKDKEKRTWTNTETIESKDRDDFIKEMAPI